MSRLVVVESPFAGHAPRWARFVPPLSLLLAAIDRQRNVRYARACVRDCLRRRDEAPIASHLLYTQPGILRDEVHAEREQGIAAGLAWARRADATVVYTDLGTSRGMQAGIADACRNGRRVERRSLPGWFASRQRRAERIAVAVSLLVLAAGLVVLVGAR
jgi:hypothetical protein